MASYTTAIPPSPISRTIRNRSIARSPGRKGRSASGKRTSGDCRKSPIFSSHLISRNRDAQRSLSEPHCLRMNAGLWEVGRVIAASKSVMKSSSLPDVFLSISLCALAGWLGACLAGRRTSADSFRAWILTFPCVIHALEQPQSRLQPSSLHSPQWNVQDFGGFLIREAQVTLDL